MTRRRSGFHGTPLVADDRRPTLLEAVDALHSGTATSVELVTEAIERANRTASMGWFHRRFDAAALERARDLDRRRAAGEDVGPLGGVPIVVKDLLATDDGPTTGGSGVLDPHWGDRGDGSAVRRLRAAGAVVLGKSTTSELGMGTPDPEPPPGIPVPRNPWDETRWTGGSSAGSAAAVAAGVVPAAVGTDSGGSIRMPAAFCGVTGLKPTYGRVPKDGVVPLAWTTDHVGPLAVSVADCALMLEVMAGWSVGDPASAEVPVRAWVPTRSADLRGVRVGVDCLSQSTGVIHPEQPGMFAAAVAVLAGAGADVVDVELPYYDELAAAAIVTTLSEALAYHRRDLVERWTDFFVSTRRTIGLAAYFSGADYVQAQRLRRAAADSVAALWRDIDVIATPTASIVATPYDRLPAFFESGEFFAVHATYWNLLGNPAISVPMGYTGEHLPLGLQLVGPHFGEAAVLRAGAAYQDRTGWHRQLPPGIADQRRRIAGSASAGGV